MMNFYTVIHVKNKVLLYSEIQNQKSSKRLILYSNSKCTFSDCTEVALQSGIVLIPISHYLKIEKSFNQKIYLIHVMM